MITCSLLCILLGIYSASSLKIDVTFNLSKINEVQFRKESQSSPNYNQFLFFPKDEYNITEVIDSGINIWKNTDGSILDSIDVYYKEFIPQLLVLNITKSLIVSSIYFKKDKDKYTELSESDFKLLEDSNDFLDKYLVLDLQKGFSNKFFMLTKVTDEGVLFDQYILKDGLILLKFTNGTDTLVDCSKGESLVKMLRLRLNPRDSILRIVKKSSDMEESSLYYECRVASCVSVIRSVFWSQCLSSASNTESQQDSSETHPSEDEYGYGSDLNDLSDAKALRKPDQESSESSTSDLEDPQEVEDLVNTAIAKHFNSLSETTQESDKTTTEPTYESPLHPSSESTNATNYGDIDLDKLNLGPIVKQVLSRKLKRPRPSSEDNEEEDEATESKRPFDIGDPAPLSEFPQIRRLSGLISGDQLEDKLKKAHERLHSDDISKSLQDVSVDDKVLETGFNYTSFGTIERSDEEECGDCESGRESMKEVKPHQPNDDYENQSTAEDEPDQNQSDQLPEDVQSPENQPGDLTLFLDADDDLQAFYVTEQDESHGIVKKIYTPKIHNLVAVKNTLSLWVADLNEVKCTRAVVHLLNNELEALKVQIAMDNGYTSVRYYNPSRFMEITKEEYDHLLESLVTKASDPEAKNIRLMLHYNAQMNVNTQIISTDFTIPYKIFTPQQGYRFTSVYLNSKLVWVADATHPYASRATYYVHFDRPAYLVLSIPESNFFLKSVTYDLVRFKQVPDLSPRQLEHLLDTGVIDHHITFDFGDPIDHEAFEVTKTDFRGFVIRNFTAKHRRVTVVYDNKKPITPTNIVPFTDFKVYYYRNLPVFLLTDPIVAPNYFSKSDEFWHSTTLDVLANELNFIKEGLDDIDRHPPTFIALNYDYSRNEKFLVETGFQNGLRYKSFVPVMGNIISTIYSKEGLLLSEREKITSSGVKFFLDNNRPFKAELLINCRKRLKKFMFKILERESGHWAQVDESIFNSY